MKVTIDGKVRDDMTFQQGQTLEDALLVINKQLIDEARFIAEIRVDETVPDLDLSLTPDQVSVDDVLAVSFETQDLVKALFDNMEQSEEKLEAFRKNLNNIVNHIISDEIDQGMQALQVGIESMMLFFNSLHQTTMTGHVDTKQVTVDGDTLHDYITKLNETLKELVSAMNNSDYTLINDYLEYEIEPALEKIIGIIPEIKTRLRGE